MILAWHTFYVSVVNDPFLRHDAVYRPEIILTDNLKGVKVSKFVFLMDYGGLVQKGLNGSELSLCGD